jgi:hypothetical protein
MLIKKKLRRTAVQTSYQTKKTEVANQITQMRLSGYSVADISAKYDVPPRVVERFCQTQLKEIMPEFQNHEYQRMLRLGQLDALMKPRMDEALDEGDHRAHDMVLKTMAQIIQLSGISDGMQRDIMKMNGVIRHEHEHSGHLQVNHEIGEKASEALALFKARSDDDRQASLPKNTHNEKTAARNLIDRQLKALPKSPPKDLEDIVDAELVEEPASNHVVDSRKIT